MAEATKLKHTIEANEQARAVAHDTLDEVHHEMSLLYS